MSKQSDAVVQTAIDRRILAKIALHMQEQGFTPRSMSHMIRMVLEIYESWIDKLGAEPVESTEEATTVLSEISRASLNPGNRYKKSMLKNMEGELAIEEDIQFGPVPKAKGRPGRWDDNEQQRLNSFAEKLVQAKREAILEQNRRAVEGATEVAGE